MAIETDAAVQVIATTGPAGPQGRRGAAADGSDGSGLVSYTFAPWNENIADGQTRFYIEGGYIPGGVLVTLDGLELAEGPDYIADDGFNIEIRQPAISRLDVLNVVTNYSVASGITPAQPDNFLLFPPTETALGGVLANEGDPGEFVKGVDPDTGALIYGVPSTGGDAGGGSTGPIPPPSSSTRGGVFSGAAGVGQFVTGIDTTGSLTYGTPASGGTGGTPGAGTVTSVSATSTDLTITGSPITSSGTLAFSIKDKSVTLAKMADVPTRGIFGSLSPTVGAPTFNSLSQHLDTLANTAGSMVARGPSAWTILPSGTAGQILTSRGSTDVPIWQSPATNAAVTAIRLGAAMDWAANQMYAENGASIGEKYPGAVAIGFASTNATSVTAVRLRYVQYLYNGSWFTASVT